MRSIFGSGLGCSRDVSALIVNCSLAASTIIQLMLNMCGVSTVAVETSQEAVDLYRAGKSFDIIIMGFIISLKDGIKAIMELRAMGVKSLIIGNLVGVSVGDFEPIVACDMDYYFEQPIGFDGIAYLLEKIENK